MKTFDVRIESSRAPAVQFRVAGDSWVAAWREALSALGDPAVPGDASCVVTPRRVEIDCPSHGWRFHIESLSEHDRRVVSGQPMLVAADGELLAVQVAEEPPTRPTARASIAPPSPRANRIDPPEPAQPTPEPTQPTPLAEDPEPPTAPLAAPQLAPPTPREGHRRPEHTPPTPYELGRGGGRGSWRDDDSDPLVRVLTDLERQRLLARPIRINPQTGLPTPIELPAAPGPGLARRDTVLSDHGPGPSVDRRVRIDLRTARRREGPKTPLTVPRPREVSLVAPGVDPTASLPQQFRPVLDELEPPSGPALFAWAADLAWQHVPCVLSLVLRGAEPLVVLAARGLREREAAGGRVVRDGARGQLQTRPVVLRIRYTDGYPLVIEHPDGNRWDLRIDSALSVPIEGAPLSLLLLNSPRPSGFTDGEASALTYLARTVAAAL